MEPSVAGSFQTANGPSGLEVMYGRVWVTGDVRAEPAIKGLKFTNGRPVSKLISQHTGGGSRFKTLIPFSEAYNSLQVT